MVKHTPILLMACDHVQVDEQVHQLVDQHLDTQVNPHVHQQHQHSTTEHSAKKNDRLR